MTIRLVSYNLLVPKLCEEPGYYFKSDFRFLQTKYRWNLIQAQLKKEIHSNPNTIICLQELCRAWLPFLETFFRRMNYKLIYRLYGQEFNDYMGVGIAIPISLKTLSVSLVNIGDHIRSFIVEKRSKGISWGGKLLKFMLGKSTSDDSDPWELAMTKRNVLVFVRLSVHGVVMCVATYHMPCLFEMPEFMIIHASVVKDLAVTLARGQNLILAGDFNTKPTDLAYRVITERSFIDTCLPQSRDYHISYQPDGRHVLKSAYRETNGREPNFTNFAATKSNPYFCATLDYIFYQGRLVVDNVLSLPKQPHSESYPDATHPSDHLMIAATFRLV